MKARFNTNGIAAAIALAFIASALSTRGATPSVDTLGRPVNPPRTASTAPAVPKEPDAPVEYIEVINVEGASASELFLRAKLWFGQAFSDSKRVLKTEDQQAGILDGKGTLPFESNVYIGSETVRGWIAFSVRVEVKEGRYRYALTRFSHEAAGSQFAAISFGPVTTSPTPPPLRNVYSPKKVWAHIQEVTRSGAETLVESLKAAMSAPAKSKDW